VAPIVQQRLPDVINVVGTIRPARRSLVGNEVPGLVERLPVRQGDLLQAGQLICQLDKTRLKLQQQQLVAQIAAQDAVIEELEAATDQATADKKRIDRLFEAGAAMEKEYRDITTAYTAAVRRLAAARFRREAIQAQAGQLADQLAKTSIKSPFGGYVVALHTEVGQWLAQGSPVVEMLDLSTVLVRVDAPSAVLPYAKEQQPCTVAVDALDRTFNGRIKHVIRQVDELARTVPIEIELANNQQMLAAGMFARADVPAGPTTDRLLVSRDAIAQQGEVRLVYVIRSRPAEARNTQPQSPSLKAGQKPSGTAPTSPQNNQEISQAVPVVVRLVGEYEGGVAIEGEALVAGDRVVVRGNEQFLLMPPGPVPVVVTAASVGTVARAPGPAANDPPASQPTSAPGGDAQ
jgi:RND family efflux transporter MFP subunit